MKHESGPQCPERKPNSKRHNVLIVVLVAIASAIWLAIRTGSKPSRILYPCQQAALANITLLKTMMTLSIPSVSSLRTAVAWLKPIVILSIISVGGFAVATDSFSSGPEPLQADSNHERVPIVLNPQTALVQENASNLFFVQNATGLEGNMDLSVAELLDLMESEGLHFYQTSNTPEGLIASDDVIIIKMNGQWDYRGGTNTDLIKSVIQMIIDHPDGFTGEVIISDNGQGLGNLDRRFPNSYYQNQSAADLAEFFSPEWDVSTVLWDDLRSTTVDDYNLDDFSNGYVRSSVWHEDTELYVSYPKFQSPATGAYISFKQGVWTNSSGFDSDRLKVINMPVLKTHFRYGVTGCIKHYMGVPQGYIADAVDTSIPHEHFSIGLGGMGTLMAETRFPVLNILDMVWINANPLESSYIVGPYSSYPVARATDIIGASLDPVAMDYWVAKHVLIPTTEYLNYTDYTSLDPDNDTIHQNLGNGMIMQDESFHNYLERSMNQLIDAGYQVTMNETEMNVFVSAMAAPGPVTPTTPTTSGTMDYLPIAIGAIAIGLFVVVLIVLRKRGIY
ncbi:MAG: DUF362 domain-containing protein [Candidatus Thorarchaeota archaeon]|nr:DUF362 domain-containing protein [Candidatus Thorarchaeota archaeon]